MRLTNPEKTILGSMAAISVIIAVILINAVLGTVVERGEVYTASYNYCAQWQATVKAQQTCIRYATGHEQRRNTRVIGPLWNYESYEVVR